MRRIIKLLTLITLVSCARTNEYSPAKFERESTASVELLGESLIMGPPVDLLVEGDYIFVLGHSVSGWVHVFDRTTGELLANKVALGRGPGEGTGFRSMDYDRSTNKLYLSDPRLNKTAIYQLSGVDGSIRFIEEIMLPHGGIKNDCHSFAGGLYLFQGYPDGEDKFTRFYLSDGGNVLDRYTEYPGITQEKDRYAFLLQNQTKSDFATGRFVSGTMYGAVLECFDVSDHKIRRTSLRLLDPPEMELKGNGVVPKEGLKWGFITFCIAGDRIFTNYIDSKDATSFTTISSFDWRGNEHVRYETGHNILRMCEDPASKNALYGIVSTPEQEFYLSRIILE